MEQKLLQLAAEYVAADASESAGESWYSHRELAVIASEFGQMLREMVKEEVAAYATQPRAEASA